MDEKIEQNTKDVELYMLAQFIDVIEVIEKFTSIEQVKIDLAIRKRLYLDYINGVNDAFDFFSLTLKDKKISDKLKKNKPLYENTKEYKKVINEIKKYKKNMIEKLNIEEKEIEKLQNSIQKKCKFETLLAYKIGLIDGIKSKKYST